MKITKDLIGAKVVVSTTMTGTIIEVEGIIEVHGSHYILVSNFQHFHNIDYIPVNITYKYALDLGAINNAAISRTTIPSFIGVRLLKEELLVKNDVSGTLFRKIYKIDGNLIFLGSIKKDPDSAKSPSGLINIFDLEHMTSKGWIFYKEEISAEEKANKEARKKPV